MKTGPVVPATSMDEAEEHRLFAFGLERIVFFSDAVFAIAITLLAIDIRIPALPDSATDAQVREAIGKLVPDLFAFALSFVVIAQFWIGHYRTFRFIVRGDGRLVALNFAFLFGIALLPFPTSVVASQGDTPTGAALYAVFVVVVGSFSTLLWLYPTRAGLAAAIVSPGLARAITLRATVIPVFFAASIPVALVAPYAAWAVWIASVPAQALVTRRLRLRGSMAFATGSGRSGRDVDG
jgi:TMEM175 potassium channel family protein